MGERLNGIQEVMGSNPTISIYKFLFYESIEKLPFLWEFFVS